MHNYYIYKKTLPKNCFEVYFTNWKNDSVNGRSVHEFFDFVGEMVASVCGLLLRSGIRRWKHVGLTDMRQFSQSHYFVQIRDKFVTIILWIKSVGEGFKLVINLFCFFFQNCLINYHGTRPVRVVRQTFMTYKIQILILRANY